MVAAVSVGMQQQRSHQMHLHETNNTIHALSSGRRVAPQLAVADNCLARAAQLITAWHSNLGPMTLLANQHKASASDSEQSLLGTLHSAGPTCPRHPAKAAVASQTVALAAVPAVAVSTMLVSLAPVALVSCLFANSGRCKPLSMA